jgi:hypothetical protein
VTAVVSVALAAAIRVNIYNSQCTQLYRGAWTTDTITTLVCELHSPRARLRDRTARSLEGAVPVPRSQAGSNTFHSGCTYLRGEELSQERKAQVHLQ